jgi:catechol 2,3-dioxygenase-like lactoylglutathione lyase family enzyme
LLEDVASKGDKSQSHQEVLRTSGMAVKAKKVVLSRLAYVVYQHEDFETFLSFAKDFGLENVGEVENGIVLFRGYGKDQYVYIAHQAPPGEHKAFLGSGFCAQSQEDFEAACSMEGAEKVDISKRPGAGQMVRIRDPNGYVIEVLYDQTQRETPSQGISAVEGGRPTLNGALDKHRKGLYIERISWNKANTCTGEFTRMIQTPAMVHKLGHFGYDTDNYEGTCDWYTSHFNFRPTDVLYAPHDESFDVATFFRLDLGQEYVDHHCFLVTRREKPGTKVHHSSFEVEDLDTQFMGHQWLDERGHELVWGIGRHVHGSQIFDYWYDSSHFIIEHYADGDVVNADYETFRAKAGNMAVWGPPVPVVWGGKKQVSA